MPDRAELYAGLYAWLILAGLSVTAITAWWCWPGRPPLLRHQRQRAVPWSLLEVVVAFVLLDFFMLALCSLLLETIGFFGWLYGPMPDAAKVAAETFRLAQVRRGIWAEVVSAPLTVAGVVFFFRRFSGTLPYQLGLTRAHASENIVRGCVTWLAVMPAVYAADWLAHWLYALLSTAPPEQHPFITLIEKGQALPAEIGALTLVTIVAAPVVEELLFRGVLQRWLYQRPRASNVVMLLAAVLAALAHGSGKGAGPLIFVLALLPLYTFIEHLLWRWIPEPQIARGILATAVLFGLAHAFAWPDPVPLTVLGFALGWLAYRTQSLVGPMIVHGLFNAFTMLTLAILPHV